MFQTGAYAMQPDGENPKDLAHFMVRGVATVFTSLLLMYLASLTPLLASQNIRPAIWIGMTVMVTLALLALRSICLYSGYALRILFALIRG